MPLVCLLLTDLVNPTAMSVTPAYMLFSMLHHPFMQCTKLLAQRLCIRRVSSMLALDCLFAIIRPWQVPPISLQCEAFAGDSGDGGSVSAQQGAKRCADGLPWVHAAAHRLVAL